MIYCRVDLKIKNTTGNQMPLRLLLYLFLITIVNINMSAGTIIGEPTQLGFFSGHPFQEKYEYNGFAKEFKWFSAEISRIDHLKDGEQGPIFSGLLVTIIQLDRNGHYRYDYSLMTIEYLDETLKKLPAFKTFLQNNTGLRQFSIDNDSPIIFSQLTQKALTKKLTKQEIIALVPDSLSLDCGINIYGD